MLTKVQDAATAYTRVAQVAEEIRNDEDAAIPFMEPGDVVVQGDVYLVMLAAALPAVDAYAGRQLAPGSTQGSRHTAEGEVTLVQVDESEATAALVALIPETANHRQFIGPQVTATEPWTVAHPEHGNRTLPAGIYLVTYQHDLVQEERRAKD